MKRERGPIDLIEYEDTCRKGSVVELRELLDAGADVNQVFKDGVTPLMQAACHQPDETCAELLLSRGAIVNAVDEQNRTAVLFACGNLAGGVAICKLLMAAGADLSIKCATGETAFICAYETSPAHMALFSNMFGVTKPIKTPTANGSDPMACVSYAVHAFGLKIHPDWAGSNIGKGFSYQRVWAKLRTVGMDAYPNYDYVYEVLIKTPCNNERTWHWLGCEMHSRREGTNHETLLHVACRAPMAAAMVAVPTLLRLGPALINPHLCDAKGMTPLRGCSAPLRAMLLHYMAWRPTVHHTRWFGPFFTRRAHAFLLVCLRVRPALQRELRYKIIAHLAEREFVCVNPFAF